MNLQQEIYPYYENIEFNLSTGQTNYDLDAEQTTFLSSFGVDIAVARYPSWVEIRTNQTISVKLNSTSNHSITITSTDSPYIIAGVLIRNMYITNASGSTAAIKLRFQENPY